MVAVTVTGVPTPAMAGIVRAIEVGAAPITNVRDKSGAARYNSFPLWLAVIVHAPIPVAVTNFPLTVQFPAAL